MIFYFYLGKREHILEKNSPLMPEAEGALRCPHTMICTFNVKQGFLRPAVSHPLASVVKGTT